MSDGWSVRESELGFVRANGRQAVQYEVVDERGAVVATIQDVGDQGRRVAHLMANAEEICRRFGGDPADWPELDARCFANDCRTKAVYTVPGRCYNCGTRYRVKATYGHERPLGATCLECGCSQVKAP